MAKVAFSEPVEVTDELQDAIRCCPHDLVSPIELIIEIAEQMAVGEWRNDDPDIEDWPAVLWVAQRLIKRERTKHRMHQMLDPDMIKMMPFASFHIGNFACERAQAMWNQLVERTSIVPLPFADCEFSGCGCEFRTRTKRDLERLALLVSTPEPKSSSGDPDR